MTALCEAFVAICEAVPKDQVPVKGKVVRLERGPWIVVLNATDAPVEVSAADTDNGMGGTVLPVHAGIWFNGWWAGEVSPAGGWIAAGDIANEETFLAAMRAKP